MVTQQPRTEVEPVIELLEASAQIAQLEAEITQLKDALAKRQQIGVATGLLAQRFGISPERAWSLLVRLSQNGHVKVRDIAQAMINAHTGRLSAADAEILSAIQTHLPGDVRLVGSAVNRQQANGDGNCSAASVRHVPLG
jgi:ANTAR domain-containing protein